MRKCATVQMLEHDLPHSFSAPYSFALHCKFYFMDLKEFYAEVGKLLYAVADVDGMITKKERDALHNLIQSRLAQREIHTDEFGTNDAWYTEFEFEIAEEQGMSAEDAFTSFSDFIDENRNKMNHDFKDICLMLADRLAESYHHTNRKEKVLIQKLKETLYSLQPLHQ
jgi:uncharacterized tellurite resistance protein B-like protein